MVKLIFIQRKGPGHMVFRVDGGRFHKRHIAFWSKSSESRVASLEDFFDINRGDMSIDTTDVILAGKNAKANFELAESLGFK